MISINIRPTSFHFLTENLTGEISFQLGETFFPERNWNDFVVIILGWWIQSYLKSIQDDSPLEFLFMDGPYLVEGNLHAGEVVELIFVDTSRERRELHRAFELRTLLKKELLSTANQVIRICRCNGVKGRDYDLLQNSYQELISKQ